MNYAPEDLDAKTFCTSMVGGYRKSAVDETIQSIAADYREAEKEMAELKSKVSVLTETVEHYTFAFKKSYKLRYTDIRWYAH